MATAAFRFTDGFACDLRAHYKMIWNQLAMERMTLERVEEHLLVIESGPEPLSERVKSTMDLWYQRTFEDKIWCESIPHADLGVGEYMVESIKNRYWIIERRIRLLLDLERTARKARRLLTRLGINKDGAYGYMSIGFGMEQKRLLKAKYAQRKAQERVEAENWITNVFN